MKGILRLLPTNVKIEPVSRFGKYKDEEFIPVIVSQYRPDDMGDEYLSYDKFWNKYHFSRVICYLTPVEKGLYDKLKIKKILINPENMPEKYLEDIKNGLLKDGDKIEL
jgi:hypothetical protein